MGCTRWIPKLSRQELERRRRAATEDLRAGKSQAFVARKYGVNESSVSRWKQTLEKEGEDGLKAKKAPGKQSKLSPEQKEQLRVILLQGSRVYGYPNELWTRKRVAKVIEDQFGVKYNFNYVAELLHKLGYSPQKPERAASERDESVRMVWINKEWEEAKKKCSKGT